MGIEIRPGTPAQRIRRLLGCLPFLLLAVGFYLSGRKDWGSTGHVLALAVFTAVLVVGLVFDAVKFAKTAPNAPPPVSTLSRAPSMTMAITVRRATLDDAANIITVWQAIVAEKVYSAIDCLFTLERERDYLNALSAREGVFLAETAERQVVGFQSLNQWTKLFRSIR